MDSDKKFDWEVLFVIIVFFVCLGIDIVYLFWR